jgi:hypothetical protein
MSTPPEPFEARHIVLAEQLVDAWLRADEHTWRLAADEILGRGALAVITEYLVGALAAERIQRVGEEEAVEQTKAVIGELQPPKRVKPHLIRIKSRS